MSKLETTNKLVIDIPQLYKKGRGNTGSQFPERDMDVIKEWSTGQKTLDEIGKKHRITRERVRQILLKRAGVSTAKVKAAQREIARREQVKRIKFVCRACGVRVSFLEGSGRNDYCLRCVPFGTGPNGLTNVDHPCSGCGKVFKLKRSQLYSLKFRKRYWGRTYCSRLCFLSKRRKVELLERQDDTK